MAVTLAQVAQGAGVSIKTASLALRARRLVAEKTYEAVKKAAEGLGYVNPRREKKSRRRLLIGVLVPENSGYYTELVQAICEYGNNLNYAIVPLVTEDSLRNEESAIGILSHLHVDGVVLGSSRIHFGNLLRSLGEETPLVGILAREPENGIGEIQKFTMSGAFSVILVDNGFAVKEAVNYLFSLGHKSIVYLGGPRTSLSERAKQAGYLQGIGDKKIKEHIISMYVGKPTYNAGFDSCQRLLYLKAEERPTAIIAYNDEMAIGSILAIQSTGLKVPEDISVIGHDDIKIAKYYQPSLTTIRLPSDYFGIRAVDILIDFIENGHWPSKTEIYTPELVKRQSTAQLS